MQTIALVAFAATLVQTEAPIPSPDRQASTHQRPYAHARHKPAKYVHTDQPQEPQLQHQRGGEVNQLPAYALAALSTPTPPSARSIARAEKRAARFAKTQLPKRIREAKREEGYREKQSRKQVWIDND